MTTPMLGQLMSYNDEGQENFTELAIFGEKLIFFQVGREHSKQIE